MHYREDVPERGDGSLPISAVILMTIVIPPGFFQFIMGLNDQETQEVAEIMQATRTIMRASPSSPGLMRMDPILQPSSPKKKRRVSKYQREFGRQLKALKRKHPRTPVTRLMKRAHSATKKAMRRK
jgi:hypothetical protein